MTGDAAHPSPPKTPPPIPQAFPTSLPPFSPRQNLLSRQSDMERTSMKTFCGTGPRFDAETIAVGCSLIVRGLTTSPADNPITVLNRKIDSVVRKHPEMKNIPVVVKPFPVKESAWTSSAYIHLHDSLKPKDPNDEPRVDLLTEWKRALSYEEPSLEVKWTPNDAGQDRRCWIRFPDLSVANGYDVKAVQTPKILPIIRKVLEENKVPINYSYGCSTGPTINVALPSHADGLLDRGTIELPTYGLQRVTAVRQIEIENPYELAIVGAPDSVEGVGMILRDWLLDTYVDDDGNSLVTDSIREVTAQGVMIFVFSMIDWRSTVKVLEDSASGRFAETFSNRAFQSMVPPALLFHVNRDAIWPGKSTRQVFQKGADTANERFDMLSLEIAALRRDTAQVGARVDAVQVQLGSIATTVTTLASSVSAIQEGQAARDTAMLIQNHKSSLMTELSQAQTNKMQLETRLLLDTGMDETQVARFTAKIKQLEAREEELRSQIDHSANNFHAIMGAPVANSLPPLPNQSERRWCKRTSKSYQLRGSKLHRDSRRQSLSAVNRLITTTFERMRRGSGQEVRHHRRVFSSGPYDEWRSDNFDPSGAEWFATVEEGDEILWCFGQSEGLSCYVSERLPLVLYLAIAMLLSLVQVAAAAQTSSSASAAFTIYGMNANSMVHPHKIAQVNNVLQGRRPHVFVVTETRSQSKLSGHIGSDYRVFEEPAQPCKDHPTFTSKWGVMLGVRKDVQVKQVHTTSAQVFKGRVVMVDIVLTTAGGRCVSHRIIAAYAPWNPGGSELEAQFWPNLTRICQESDVPWTIVGDLNATVAQLERASGGSTNRLIFNRFIGDAAAVDLWSRQPDRTLRTDWTCRGGKAGGGSIIDRAVTSSATFVDGEIAVTDKYNDFVESDHRGIIATIIHAAPSSNEAEAPPLLSHLLARTLTREGPPPRIRVPLKAEKHKYDEFRQLVDRRIEREDLRRVPIADDEAFIQRYEQLTRIITGSATEVFGRKKPYQARKKAEVTNEKIQNIVGQQRNIGAAIYAEKMPRGHQSLRVMRLVDALKTEHRCVAMEYPSYLMYLQARRKALNKELYAAKKQEILTRAKEAERRKTRDTLRGASTKKLFQTDFVPHPFAVNDLDNPERLIADPEGVKKTTKEYFRRLFDRSNHVEAEKPWMLTSSVEEVKTRVKADPFEWPRRATL
ncbi:hypothetical protein NMY22_g13014 [Coprinellus aureogranulatus]|nr:hypothetical protein NMY22_g13014 [Coprinellus aureogranulatus]